MPVSALLGLVGGALTLAGLWAVFRKAGEAGWQAIVPFYNALVLARVAGAPLATGILVVVASVANGVLPALLAPGATTNAIIGLCALLVFALHAAVAARLSRRFAHGTGTTTLLALFPFIGYPYLGFSGAKYLPPPRKTEILLNPDGSPVRTDLGNVEPVPGASKPDAIVVADAVHRQFGGLVAVDVDHLELPRGRITGLIGPNGAGKTTFFNLLTGFDEPDRGEWSFDGRDLSGVPSHEVALGGMVRTFQLTKALSRLTVLENMKLGAQGQTGEGFLQSLLPPLWRRQERQIEARALALLERFKLLPKKDDFAGTLSGGQRKLLEMARALMTEPKMVMLDEPMAGVNPALTQALLGHIKDLREQGMTVLFVEHDMDVVMDISDWVVCMAEGRIIAEGPPQSVATNSEVIDAYLGREHDAASEERPQAAAAVQEDSAS